MKRRGRGGYWPEPGLIFLGKEEAVRAAHGAQAGNRIPENSVTYLSPVGFAESSILRKSLGIREPVTGIEPVTY